MADEPKDEQVVEEPQAEETQDLGSSNEDTQPEVESSQGQNEQEAEGSENSGQSERAKSRQHELAEKLKEKSRESATLRAQAEKAQRGEFDSQPNGGNQDFPWWSQQQQSQMQQQEQDPGVRELTPQEYEQHLMQRANLMWELRDRERQVREQKIQTVESDINYLEETYPEVKEDKALNEELAGLYAEARRNNPNLSMRAYLEPILKARSKGREVGRDEASEALVRQRAESAPRPGGSSEKRVSSEQQLAEMMRKGEITAEEAEAYLPKD